MHDMAYEPNDCVRDASFEHAMALNSRAASTPKIAERWSFPMHNRRGMQENRPQSIKHL